MGFTSLYSGGSFSFQDDLIEVFLAALENDSVFQFLGAEALADIGDLPIVHRDATLLDVEAGVGLYADKVMKPTKNSTLQLNAGVALYHEFADPYTMELGMQDMAGSFKLRDERRKDNRAVVRTGFDYQMGDITVEGSFATFVDGTTHTKAGLDLRYNF